MIARRITGRAAVMAASALLFAGTAAAASGVFTNSGDAIAGVDAGSTATSTDPTVTDPTDSTGTTDSTVPAVTDPTDTTELPEGYGLCTAWHAGHAKSTDNPAFAKLQNAADHHSAGDIEAYCEEVFADKAAHHDDDSTGTTIDDDSDDDSTGTTIDDDDSDDDSTGTGIDDDSDSDDDSTGTTLEQTQHDDAGGHGHH